MEKLAATVIDAMKAQPLAVALVVINVLFLAASGYILDKVANATRAREERQNQLLSQIAKRCFDNGGLGDGTYNERWRSATDRSLGLRALDLDAEL